MLDFKPHPNYPLGATQAEIHFPNGYGASVITGEMFYTSPEKPYELAVLDGDDLTYETPITDDVIGYLDYDEVLEILSEIEKLPPKTIV